MLSIGALLFVLTVSSVRVSALSPEAQSRYDKGNGDDYINCPLTKEEYDRFIDELIQAEKVSFRDL